MWGNCADEIIYFQEKKNFIICMDLNIHLQNWGVKRNNEELQ